MNNKLRKCKVGKDKRSAFFHGWFQYGSSAENDGMGCMGIVEFEDGSVDEFMPKNITFDMPTEEKREDKTT